MSHHFKTEKSKSVRRPGIEPGSIAWKATMLTITPPTLVIEWQFFNIEIYLLKLEHSAWLLQFEVLNSKFHVYYQISR